MKLAGLGLGMAALGRPGYINLGHAEDLGRTYDLDAMERHAHQVLDAAYDAGVRYFDAARSYGEAERFLSTWMSRRSFAPGAVAVGSKWGYRYTAGWQVEAEVHEVKDHSRGHFDAQLVESRRLLGRHLGLYQIHSATLDTGVLEDQAVLDGLRRLRSEGVAVGFSTSGPEQAAIVEKGLEAGVFDTVQVTYNLLERSAEPALRAAKEAGLTVIVKEAVANGRLTPRGARPGVLEEEAARLGATVDAVAIAFALQQPFVDLVLSGAATEAQVRSNARATELGEVASMTALIEPPPQYWATRKSLAWN